MTTTDTINYTAAEGCFIVRKDNQTIMGKRICLGTMDSIDNYEDQEYTEESYKAFYEKIGMPIEEKQHNVVEEQIDEK